MSADEELWDACDRGDLGRIRELLPQADCNWQHPTNSYRTGLLAASSHGHRSVVEYLLQSCPTLDVNVHCKFPEHTAVSLAAQRGHRAIFRLLIADPRTKLDIFQNYGTLLFHCSSHNILWPLRVLLRETRADPNMRGGGWESPIHMALFKGHHEAVKLLLASDATIELHYTSCGVCCPLEKWIRNIDPEMRDLLGRYRSNPAATRASLRKELNW